MLSAFLAGPCRPSRWLVQVFVVQQVLTVKTLDRSKLSVRLLCFVLSVIGLSPYLWPDWLSPHCALHFSHVNLDMLRRAHKWTSSLDSWASKLLVAFSIRHTVCRAMCVFWQNTVLSHWQTIKWAITIVYGTDDRRDKSNVHHALPLTRCTTLWIELINLDLIPLAIGRRLFVLLISVVNRIRHTTWQSFTFGVIDSSREHRYIRFNMPNQQWCPARQFVRELAVINCVSILRAFIVWSITLLDRCQKQALSVFSRPKWQLLNPHRRCPIVLSGPCRLHTNKRFGASFRNWLNWQIDRSK